MVAPKPAPPPPTSAGGGKLCMMCTSDPIAVTFHPCGHQVACSQCSSRMKQCFSCHERIQEKVRMDIRKSRTVIPAPLLAPFYSHYTGQPAIAGACVTPAPPVKNWRILLEQRFTACIMPHALARGNKRIRIREKTLEFSSTVVT